MIDKVGFADVVVQYLELTELGHLRKPSFKKVLK